MAKKSPPKPFYPLYHDFVESAAAFAHQASMLADSVDQLLGLGQNKRPWRGNSPRACHRIQRNPQRAVEAEMPYIINMGKALDAATQGLVDAVREDYGLDPMPVEEMPRGDQLQWRRRVSKALAAALQFVK